MGSAPSEHDEGLPLAIFKIIIAGGFGAGKTTLVGAISEVRPLCTEEVLTSVSAGFDDLAGVEDKKATTVAMDFGRITFGSHLLLYLFGTPGQDRFWFMWDELSYGALGAVVLADTRRLADCFPSVDYFEKRQIPFVVAINCFDGAPAHNPEDVRIALDLDPLVPAVPCDARQPDSVKRVLIALVEHVLASGLSSGAIAGPGRTSRLPGAHRDIPAGAGLAGAPVVSLGRQVNPVRRSGEWDQGLTGNQRQEGMLGGWKCRDQHRRTGAAALAGDRPAAPRAGPAPAGLRCRVHHRRGGR